jgi:leader peptidase (prepilin peptidase)/N-methyltransferase
MFLIWTLICLAVLDLEHLWLPDSVTLPGIAFGFFWWFIQGEQVGWALHMPSEPAQDAKNAGERLMGIVVAAGLILLIRWIYWLIRRREGIGLGDAKLMALLAAWLGLPGALLAFGIGVVLGAIVALVLLAVRAARRDSESWAVTKLPLGTFLCIGGIIGSLWGRQIIASYLRWTGL